MIAELILLSDNNKGLERLQLSINDDVEKIVFDFNPDIVVAESEEENEIVFEASVNNLSGFSLYHPSIDMLERVKRERETPKIFLMDKDSDHAQEFSECGLVAHTLEEYEKESIGVCYICLTFD